ncbi:Cell wall protein PRY3 [Tolypocladium paradoxum]|uniref:Cell wall protein PRY3 n=1 Tax=Tolypocladium paradoxum TaxID=94208 RepID=A0A2S4KL62_9HYPO|nr:Cell wall protein PRY3 [Tolypocladium paradoxum]
MKSSLFLVAASALLASAGPLRKRVMETDWVYEVVTVTVTAGQEAAPVPTAVFVESKQEPTPEPINYTPPPAPPVPTVTEPEPTMYNPPPPPPVPTVTKPKPTEQAPPQPTTLTPVVSPPTPSPQPTTTTQPAKGSNPPPYNPDNYEQTMLDQHNIHRRNHSAPDLVWDGTLAKYAENTGNTCVFQHDMNQGGGGYGQNLASWGGSGDINGLRVKMGASGVTEQWYNGEMSSWQFYGQPNAPENSDLHAWGHFTQVVWKSSTKVGCATVKCAAGTIFGMESWYTVCNYNPPGNFGGEYGNNVLKPHGDQVAHV